MKSAKLVPALLVLLAGPSLAKEMVKANNVYDFDTPSMNICCTYNEDAGYYPDAGRGPQLSCIREKPDYWLMTLRPDGKFRLMKNPGEAPGCGYGQPLGNVLNYGESTTLGRFTCTSARGGLICKAGSKGFKVSRKGVVQLK
jgi:hypothetical protein